MAKNLTGVVPELTGVTTYGAARITSSGRIVKPEEGSSQFSTVLGRQRGLRWKLAWQLVDSAQRYAPLREDALADAGLGWPVLRHSLRELGGRLATAGAVDTPDDVFWL